MKKVDGNQAKERKKQSRRKWLLLLVALLSIAMATVLALWGATISGAHLEKGKLVRPQRVVHMVGANGEDIGRASAYVPYDQMPDSLWQAFVAVEDKRFFQHKGLDGRRIVGALLQNIREGRAAQGASTISCQLIKNTHLNQSKTLQRKVVEAHLAGQLEKAYSKQEILEMYLNVIYLGEGYYGVGAAARGYFDKSVDELTVAECAALAASCVNPARFAPSRERNAERRGLVLDLMCKQGYIAEDERDSAKKERVAVCQKDVDPFAIYRHQALAEAAQLLGLSTAEIMQRNYVVETYCDTEKQRQAVSAVELNDEGDCLVLQAEGNGIVAYHAGSYVSPSTLRRQPGSMLKPFIYALAIEKGILLPDSVVVDEPCAFGDYQPHNYRDIYYGRISAATALAKSSNVVAVKTLTYVGVEKAQEFLVRCGIPCEKDGHLALALGGMLEGVTPVELLRGYGVLVDGCKKNLQFVRSVLDGNGNVVYRHEPTKDRVLSEESAFLVGEMLKKSLVEGTARGLGEYRERLAAKTGTVDGGEGNSDAWCIAYDKDTTTLSWVGNLSMEKDRMVEASGGGTPCRMVRQMIDNPQMMAPPMGVCRCQFDRLAQGEGRLEIASENTPLRYCIEGWAKRNDLPEVSTTFLCPAPVEGEIKRVGEQTILSLSTNPFCDYLVRYYQGHSVVEWVAYGSEPTTEIILPYPDGRYGICAILHGKTDVIGEEKFFMLY